VLLQNSSERLEEVNTIPIRNCNTVLVSWSDQRYRLCTTWLSNSQMEIKSTVSSKQYNWLREICALLKHYAA